MKSVIQNAENQVIWRQVLQTLATVHPIYRMQVLLPPKHNISYVSSTNIVNELFETCYTIATSFLHKMLLFHNIVFWFIKYSMLYMKSVVKFKCPAQQPKGYRSYRRDIVRSSECGSISIMGISYYSSVRVTQQDRQWTYNVTLRHVPANTDAVEMSVLNILNVYLYP